MKKISDEEFKKYLKQEKRAAIISYLELALWLIILFIAIPLTIFYGLWLLLLPATFWERFAWVILAIILTGVMEVIGMYASLAWEGEI